MKFKNKFIYPSISLINDAIHTVLLIIKEIYLDIKRNIEWNNMGKN